MRIEVRLFARLREKLPRGSARGRCQLTLPRGSTVGEALARMGLPLASAQIVLVNGQQTRDLGAVLRDGDVLSVFPPLAGGSGRA